MRNGSGCNPWTVQRPSSAGVCWRAGLFRVWGGLVSAFAGGAEDAYAETDGDQRPSCCLPECVQYGDAPDNADQGGESEYESESHSEASAFLSIRLLV